MTDQAAYYWEVRSAILSALSRSDDAELKRLAEAHPKVFANVVAQAKNALRKRGRSLH